jgi:hypothetical protein
MENKLEVSNMFLPIQKQTELIAAAEPLVDHGDRGTPERVRPRQGAQPAAADWPLVREDRAPPRGRTCGFGRRDAGARGVQRDRLGGAAGRRRRRGTAACRTGAGCRARLREQERAGCRAATERNPREARMATASCAGASARPAPAAWPVTAVTVGTGRNACREAVPQRRGRPRARPREVVAVAEAVDEELALGGQDERTRIPN